MYDLTMETDVNYVMESEPSYGEAPKRWPHIEYTIIVAFDDEAQKWYAQNDDIPLILEDYSLDKLVSRVKIAAPEMLEMNNLLHKDVKISFKIEPQAVVV